MEILKNLEHRCPLQDTDADKADKLYNIAMKNPDTLNKDELMYIAVHMFEQCMYELVSDDEYFYNKLWGK